MTNLLSPMLLSVTKLFWASIVLYTLAPNRWNKALPCIFLFLGFDHEIDVAFLFAGLGDLLLHDNFSIQYGTLCFAIANLIFGTVFLEYNYANVLAKGGRGFDPWCMIIHPTMICIWLISCSLLYFITNNHWKLFSIYALTMIYAIFQAFSLEGHSQIPFFMMLFLLSDLLVLLAFEPQDLEWLSLNTIGYRSDLEIRFVCCGEWIVRPFGILHGIDLGLYWLAMWGLHKYIRW